VLRVLTGGVLAVPAVAAGRGLGGDRHRAADRADASGRIIWEISVDSMITRTHQNAADARSTPQKESAGGVTDPATLAKIAVLAHIHDKQRGDCDPWACPVDRLVQIVGGLWITLGWLFLPASTCSCSSCRWC
jgi:hypothetical protein